MPLNQPNWDPNHKFGRWNMKPYRCLMVKGIREAVPLSSNTKLAFDSPQEKDESPSVWLARLKRNFQLYLSEPRELRKGTC